MADEALSSNSLAEGPSILWAWTQCRGNTPAWPKWSTLRKNANLSPVPITFTLRIQPVVVDYTKASTHEAATVEVFEDAATHINSIRDIINQSQLTDKLEQILVEQMTKVVFGSNFIERAGLGLDETTKLCRIVFHGSHPSNIPARSPQYQERLEELAQNSGGSLPSTEIRDRREVINHAGAFMYMIDKIINNDEFFTEELICATHKILVHGVDALHEKGPATHHQQYGGIYRHVHVSAGSNNFVNPKFVGRAMRRFVNDLNDKLEAAEKDQEIDPFFIAADACGEFVNIHPFLDGNGRTCRLILNTILLKYAGTVAPIGEISTERAEYLDIAKRMSVETGS
ncbi:hypothetical protein H072_2403 [Dactylellina haptotyla CBS 200.50]|uniref:Fido domain-containing protein n=1 Tax=Dactylellina haptotyla (strain CBS 200.50) TaxID=1284197 RepID=S8ARJ5_DACHA|nr:hypothetical protein H072_2403 [Dactylellina haptotyla CBS 200.50]